MQDDNMQNLYTEYNWGETDPSTWTGWYLYNSLKSFLVKQKGKRILDIGCGNGFITNKFIDEGFDIYGIDASKSGIEVCRRSNPSRFYVCDVHTMTLPLELKDKKFDLIISTEVIEHLYDPRRYILFCKSILLSNGHGELLISTPYNGYLKNLAMSLLNGWDKHFTVLWDGGHVKFFSVKTLTSLLEEYGFKVVEFKGSGRVPYLWKSMFIRAII